MFMVDRLADAINTIKTNERIGREHCNVYSTKLVAYLHFLTLNEIYLELPCQILLYLISRNVLVGLRYLAVLPFARAYPVPLPLERYVDIHAKHSYPWRAAYHSGALSKWQGWRTPTQRSRR